MSRRSRTRRKEVRLTIQNAGATPRALRQADARLRGYPGIHEILAASIVSAVGLAAGCGGGTRTAESTSPTTTVQTTTTTTTPVTDTATVVNVDGTQTVLPVTDIPCAGAPPPMQVAQQGPPAPAPPGHRHHPRAPVSQ